MAISQSPCWNSTSIEEGKRLLLRGDLVRAGSVAAWHPAAKHYNPAE
jgi:hypothetical protein